MKFDDVSVVAAGHDDTQNYCKNIASQIINKTNFCSENKRFVLCKMFTDQMIKYIIQ